jgi:hypothetical protein
MEEPHETKIREKYSQTPTQCHYLFTAIRGDLPRVATNRNAL